jgi:hypothetical protein
MSAIGTKQTSLVALHMSAFGGKADIARPPSKPVDPKKDQVEETRRVLRETNDRANRAIDEQTGRRRT